MRWLFFIFPTLVLMMTASCDNEAPEPANIPESTYLPCQKKLWNGEYNAAVSICADIWKRNRTRKSKLLTVASLMGLDRISDAEKFYYGDSLSEIIFGNDGAIANVVGLASMETNTVEGAIGHNKRLLEITQLILDYDKKLGGIWTRQGDLYVKRSRYFDHLPNSESGMKYNLKLAIRSYDEALKLKHNVAMVKDKMVDAWIYLGEIFQRGTWTPSPFRKKDPEREKKAKWSREMAIQSYDEALKLDPKNAKARELRAGL